MAEFVDEVADLLVASGVATGLYTTSGTSLQVNYRRDTGAPTVLLLRQSGGTPLPKADAETYTLQALVDSETNAAAKSKARELFDFLHERTRVALPSHDVLWIRAVTLPQSLPLGPNTGGSERFQFSVNFNAFIRKAGGG